MKDSKKSLKEVLPNDQLKNSEQFADHLKSPMHNLQSKETVLKNAMNTSYEEEE